MVSDQSPVVVPKLGWLWPGLALAGGRGNGVPR